ncbi:hypothetical protein TNCV_4039851 [Trichonephila clavipes]|nr:hypothetical protein TNCV_4039851 [Trichonephila clavipes]
MVPRLRRVKGAVHITSRVTNEGRKIRSGYPFHSERMRVLYRSRQNDRLRVMFVLVHIDITPPQIYRAGRGKIIKRLPVLGEKMAGKHCSTRWVFSSTKTQPHGLTVCRLDEK